MAPRSAVLVLLFGGLLCSHGAMGEVTLPDPTEPLHTAASVGNLVDVKSILAGGTDINVRDEHGCTPLIWAISGGQSQMALFLIKEGADVNRACLSPRTGAKLYTPLCVAARSGDADVVNALLDKGAAVDFEGVGGQPVHWAAREGNGEIIWLLTNSGASLYAVDQNGKRPLKLAWNNGHWRTGFALFFHDLKVLAGIAWTELRAWWLGMWVYLQPIVIRFSIPLLVFSMFMVVFCHRLALEKNKSVVLWTILGSIPVLNMISLLYLVGASNIALERKVDRLLHMLEVYTLHGKRREPLPLVLDDETLDEELSRAPAAPERNHSSGGHESADELRPPKALPLEPADVSPDEAVKGDETDLAGKSDVSDRADESDPPDKPSPRVKTVLRVEKPE